MKVVDVEVKITVVLGEPKFGALAYNPPSPAPKKYIVARERNWYPKLVFVPKHKRDVLITKYRLGIVSSEVR